MFSQWLDLMIWEVIHNLNDSIIPLNDCFHWGLTGYGMDLVTAELCAVHKHSHMNYLWMQGCPAGETGGRRCSHVFLTYLQSRSVIWKSYFSLCLGFPQRKQDLQLVSMAAVLLWIQSWKEIFILDCARGVISSTHILQCFCCPCKLPGNWAWGPSQWHCWEGNHIPACSSPRAKVCLNFLSLGLLNISPANSLCHTSLARASSLSVLCLFVANMNCDISRGSFTISGDKEGCEQQSVSHILVSCKAETDSRVWIELIASSLADTSCGRSCFWGPPCLPQGWLEKKVLLHPD